MRWSTRPSRSTPSARSAAALHGQRGLDEARTTPPSGPGVWLCVRRPPRPRSVRPPVRAPRGGSRIELAGESGELAPSWGPGFGVVAIDYRGRSAIREEIAELRPPE